VSKDKYHPSKVLGPGEVGRFKENIRRAQATAQPPSKDDSCMVALGAIALAGVILALVAGVLGTVIYYA
jgi:hypothetical protein